MTGRLDGKVALITGASSGIGLAIAKRFAQEGAKVALADINETDGEKAAQEIGGNAIFIKLNVTEEDQWEAAYKQVIEHFGKVNVAVNNAGIGDGYSVEDLPLDVWNKVIGINGTGVFLGIKHAVRNIKNYGGGSIINMSSIEGFVGAPMGPAYNFTKGGVRILTKSSALYCADNKLNIRVNSIHPGFIHTPLVDVSPELVAQEQKKTPLGRLGQPEEIANMAVFLASDESSYCTGAEYLVDGGYTAQ